MNTTQCTTCGARITHRIKHGASVALDVDTHGSPTGTHRCSGTAPTVTAYAPTAPATATNTPTATAASAPTVDDADTVTPDDFVNAFADAYAEAAREAEAERRAAMRNAHHPVKARWNGANREQRVNGDVPAIDGAYNIAVDEWNAIAHVLRVVRDTGRPANIGLWGEPGSGKTTLGLQIGAIRQSPTYIIETGGKETASDWYFETIGIDRDGTVINEPSAFVRGIETPGATVIINDVANLQAASVQNGLNELLDPSTRATYVPALRRVVAVAPGVIIVGTWNVGTVSAREISAQILDRFASGAIFEVPLLTDGELTDMLVTRTGVSGEAARRLSLMADWLRGDEDPIPVNTRALIAAAEMIAHGARIGHAIGATVIGQHDVETRTRAGQIIDTRVGEAFPDEPLDDWAMPRTDIRATLADIAAGESFTGTYTDDSADSGDSDSDSDSD